MADLLSDGNVRVYWVTSISNINAPTVAELNAGTRLDTVMTPDGLQREFDSADIDNSALSDTFDTTAVGRRKPTIGVTFKRATGTDTIANLLTYQASGYLVVRDNITASTAWATSQIVDVFPAQCKAPSKMFGPNTVQRMSVPMSATSAPALSVAVA